MSKYPFEGKLGIKLDDLLAKGYVLTFSKGQHYTLQSPKGRKTFFPASPSDHRGPLNTVRDIKRMERLENEQ